MTPELVDKIIDKITDLVLVIGLLVLGMTFGLGKVEKESSYGLTEVVAVIGVIAGGRVLKGRENASKT